MFLRRKFPLSALIVSFVFVAAGCGDGKNSESTVQSDSNVSAPAAPAPELSASSLAGDIAWDFTIGGTGEELNVYRMNLAANSISFVQQGDANATNLFANGGNTDDLYSPALVTAKNGRLTIHSRIDGQSYQLVDIKTRQNPCSLQAYANSDLSAGVIYLGFSEADSHCPAPGTGSGRTVGISFADGEAQVWEAMKGSVIAETVYNDAGEIELLIAVNADTKTTTLYDSQGNRLSQLTGTYRLPRVSAIGPRGVTRDDRYLAILTDGRFYIASVSQFLASNIAALSPAISGLSLNSAFLSSKEPLANRLALIRDNDVVYGLDQVTRTTEQLADFSSRSAAGFGLEYALLVGDTLVAVLNTAGNESGEFQGEVWTKDLGSDGAPELKLEADSRVSPSVLSTSHAYLGYLEELPLPEEPEGSEETAESDEPEEPAEPEYALKTLIVEDGGATRIPAGSTRFISSRNSAKGGEEEVILALRSDTFSVYEGFITPEIWAVNSSTGEFGQMVKRLYTSCFGFEAERTLNEQVHILSACAEGVSLGILDTELGTLDHYVRF